jgi:hypothetical protein
MTVPRTTVVRNSHDDERSASSTLKKLRLRRQATQPLNKDQAGHEADGHWRVTLA